MTLNQIASRYAKALLAVSYEKNLVRGVYNDMKNLNIIYKSHPEVLLILKNKTLPSSHKRIFITKLLLDGINDLTLKFFFLLEKKQRMSLLIDIVKIFLSKYNKSKDLKTVHITTVVKMSKDLKDKIGENIKLAIKSQKVKIIEYLDSSILGGYIVRVGDNQIDNSISSKLKKMRSSIIF